jgi:hypothetical protein
MNIFVNCYRFSPQVPVSDIQDTFDISEEVAQILLEPENEQFSVVHTIDPEIRMCLIESHSLAGKIVNSLFAGYMLRDYGKENIQVCRVESYIRPNA